MGIMRTCLTEKEFNRLYEVGFCNNDGSMIGTLDKLLEMIPESIEVYRYRPEERWEGMSHPTYWIYLEISKCDGLWKASYGETCFNEPELNLVYEDKELIRCLYLLIVSVMTAPKEWICKI